jgi:foldase protein PrsA
MPKVVKTKALAKRKTLTQKSESTSAVKTVSTKHQTRKKLIKLWGAALIVIILLGLAYLGKGLFLVALVNGKPISRLAQIKKMEQTVTQNGQTAGKESLNNLITEELIAQEAKKENIIVDDADVQAQIDDIEKSVQAQGTTLDAELSMRGMTRTDLEKSIKLQKTVEAILAPQLAVSDEDVEKYFEDNKDYYGTNAKFEDLKDSVKSDLEQEKFTTEFQKWYQQLQSESDIKYFVSF